MKVERNTRLLATRSYQRVAKSFPFLLLACLLLALNGRDTAAEAATPALVINEIMVSNGTAVMDPTAKNYADWLEIYNPGDASLDMEGMYLSDDPNDLTKWEIPSGLVIESGGHLLFWADDKADQGGSTYKNHTNFKLKHGGEVLTLTDSDGETVIDQLDYTAIEQLPDVSYGRETDGAAAWVYFAPEEATPADTNDTAAGIADINWRVPEPTFSLARGFYAGSQSVELATLLDGAHIYYTTNGALPTQNDSLYSGPITISETAVVKARAFKAGYLPSSVVFQTYFIDDPGSVLPVVSLSTDPDNLFDDDIGIYTRGDGSEPNYEQDWERPMSFEFFEVAEDGHDFQFAFNGGMKIHGNYTRRLIRKSLDIRTRTQYGSEPVQYKLFEDRDRDEFESFILRTSGGDLNRTLFRDALAHSVVEHAIDIDIQGYRPAALFINGEYWGIHNIREKTNPETIASNHDVDEDALDLIKRHDTVVQGSFDHYDDLLDFVEDEDMSLPENYEYVKTQMEVDEFMNYYIAEIFTAKTSWPAANLKFWRPQTPTGRWRWLMFDVDSGFNLRDDERYEYDELAYALGQHPDDNPPSWSTALLSNLMDNTAFKHEFAQRYAAYLNIIYHPERVKAIIDAMQAAIDPEIERHLERWDGYDWQSIGDRDDWEENVDVMREFAEKRPGYMFQHLDNNLNLDGTRTLTIKINIPGSGQVRVHDATIPPARLEAPAGFEGDFFRNIPIRLEAIPYPGYRFAGWEGADNHDQAVSTVTIDADHTVTADFEPYTPPAIVINEIHYHPSEEQGPDEVYEFIELYNNSGQTVDLARYRFTQGIAYTFTAGTSMAPGEYIVLAKNAATYAGQDYQVFEWTAERRLSNRGELLELVNDIGHSVDQVIYSDRNGWIETPDGQGPSLELIDPNLDNAGDAVEPSALHNWAASAEIGGTPGRANVDPPQPLAIALVESGGSTAIAEAGLTDTYTIALSYAPTAPVTVTVTPDNQLDLGHGAGAPVTLIFDSATFTQTVTVTAVDDAVVDTIHLSSITHTVNSENPAYQDLALPTVAVTVADNDPLPGVTIFESEGTTAVTEGGASDSYEIVLDRIPASDVTITVVPDDQIDLGLGPGTAISLTFRPDNAFAPQTVTVTAADDDGVEGDHQASVLHVVHSADPLYDAFVVPDVNALIHDNDVEDTDDTNQPEIYRLHFPFAPLAPTTGPEG